MKVLIRRGMQKNFVGFDLELSEEELKDKEKLFSMLTIANETREFLMNLKK